MQMVFLCCSLFFGCKGDKGNKGNTGTTGQQGNAGATGATGPQGPAGSSPNTDPSITLNGIPSFTMEMSGCNGIHNTNTISFCLTHSGTPATVRHVMQMS